MSEGVGGEPITAPFPLTTGVWRPSLNQVCESHPALTPWLSFQQRGIYLIISKLAKSRGCLSLQSTSLQGFNSPSVRNGSQCPVQGPRGAAFVLASSWRVLRSVNSIYSDPWMLKTCPFPNQNRVHRFETEHVMVLAASCHIVLPASPPHPPPHELSDGLGWLSF